MANTLTIQIEHEHEIDEDTVAYPKIELEVRYQRGSPAVMYQRNGDPGWPAEDPEIEVISATPIDGDGLTLQPEQWRALAEAHLACSENFHHAVDLLEAEIEHRRFGL